MSPCWKKFGSFSIGLLLTLGPLTSRAAATTYPKSALCAIAPTRTLTCSCQCWAGWTYVANSGKIGYLGPYTGMKVLAKGPFANGYAAKVQNTNPIMQNSVRIDIQCHN